MNEYDGDAFDEAFMKSWLALERKLAELGKEVKFDIESWTIELGSGMEMKPESVKTGVKGIKNYLITVILTISILLIYALTSYLGFLMIGLDNLQSVTFEMKMIGRHLLIVCHWNQSPPLVSESYILH